jgi:hypothetical protein
MTNSQGARGTTRARDGVLAVVEYCYRSVNIERAFKIMIYSKISLDSLPLWSRF